MTSARPALRRVVVAVLLTVGLTYAVAGTASAHDVLISSNPVGGSTVNAVPSSITFQFDQPVQNFDPVIALIGPDGKHYETGTPQVNGNSVTGDASGGPAGAYIASYRVVSADGHPVTGEVHFTLAVAASGTGAPASGTPGSSSPGSNGAGSSGFRSSAATGADPVAVATAVAAPSTKSGLSAGIWIALVIAALVIAAAAVILLRRPSGGNSSGANSSEANGSGTDSSGGSSTGETTTGRKASDKDY